MLMLSCSPVTIRPLIKCGPAKKLSNGMQRERLHIMAVICTQFFRLVVEEDSASKYPQTNKKRMHFELYDEFGAILGHNISLYLLHNETALHTYNQVHFFLESQFYVEVSAIPFYMVLFVSPPRVLAIHYLPPNLFEICPRKAKPFIMANVLLSVRRRVARNFNGSKYKHRKQLTQKY